MATVARKQAPRPARPAGRYWKGKAPKGAADLPSSDEEDEEELEQERAHEADEDVALTGEQDFLSGAAMGDEDEDEDGDGLLAPRKLAQGKMSIALRDVNISKDGKVIVGGKTASTEDEEGSLSA